MRNIYFIRKSCRCFLSPFLFLTQIKPRLIIISTAINSIFLIFNLQLKNESVAETFPRKRLYCTKFQQLALKYLISLTEFRKFLLIFFIICISSIVWIMKLRTKWLYIGCVYKSNNSCLTSTDEYRREKDICNKYAKIQRFRGDEQRTSMMLKNMNYCLLMLISVHYSWRKKLMFNV